MESPPTHIPTPPQQPLILHQLQVGLEQYSKDRSKLQVWSRVFYLLNIYLIKDGPISEKAQNAVNLYLANKMESNSFGQLVSQYKDVIGKVYDMAQDLDTGLADGTLTQNAIKKCEKNLNSQLPTIVKAFSLAIEAVALHFCIFLNKLQHSTSILPTFRQYPKILRRKYQNYTSQSHFMNVLLKQTVLLLDGYMSEVKTALSNYINIQSLLEISSAKVYKNKKALLIGYTHQNINNIVGKSVNLNSIVQNTFAGRKQIEQKLLQIKVDNSSSINEHIWSLLIPISSELQPQLNLFFQKLPVFLRPLTNLDILSMQRNKLLPTYRYRIYKQKYCEGPFLMQLVQVFYNCGNTSFDIISIPNNQSTVNTLANKNLHGLKLWQNIQKYGIIYTKIRVHPKNIAILTPNNYYMLYCCDKSSQQIQRSQIYECIQWNTLPKQPYTILQCTTAIKSKKAQNINNYFTLPIQQMLLDYISHSVQNITEPELINTLVQVLESKFLEEEKILAETLQNNPKIQVSMKNINYLHKFCMYCCSSILNYCAQLHSKQIICMNCTKNSPKLKDSTNNRIQLYLIFHHPNSLRYPITLLKLKINKLKVPGDNIQNKYEKEVCEGEYVGSYDNYRCEGTKKDNLQIPNSILSANNVDILLFFNRMKEMHVVTGEQTIIEMATRKRPKNRQEYTKIVQNIQKQCKGIIDVQMLKKMLVVKFQQDNMVVQAMYELVRPQKLFPEG